MKKTVLITGSSSGIGKATARLFHAKGWNVAATMRSPEQETELLQLPGVKLLRLDVLDPASIKQAIDETIRHFGRIDVVVNNAGYAMMGAFEASTAQQVERQFSTNVFGLMNVTQEIIPYFREKKGGTIVQVASIGGRLALPLYSLYHGTKWAVEGFSESLQHEVRQFGIRIKIIEPGPVKTDFYDRSMEIAQKEGLTAYDPYIKKARRRMDKLGRLGVTPEKIAAVIYRAATSNDWKLRYSGDSKAAVLLLMRKLLPDRLFNGFLRRLF